MTDLNKLSIAIKQLQTENRKYTIEVIGNNRDMYQNILPMCFDITFLCNQRNQYNQLSLQTESDAYLIDGVGPSFTRANYTIVPIFSTDEKEILEYVCKYTPYVDVTAFTTYVQNEGILYF